MTWLLWGIGLFGAVYASIFIFIFKLTRNCPPLTPGWVDKTRWATSKDGPVLAYHQKSIEGDWTIGNLYYLTRPLYLIIWPIMRMVLPVHEHVHPLIEDSSDCPNRSCAMYGNENNPDSWSEKDPLVWIKVVIHRVKTGSWYCEDHQKRIDEAINKRGL